MLIIGERINATRKRVGQATVEKDAQLIKEEAKRSHPVGHLVTKTLPCQEE